MWGFFFRSVRIAAIVVLLGASLLHVTLRDGGGRWLAALYYALPLPALILGWLGLAALPPRSRRHRAWRWVWVSLALTCGVLWQRTAFRHGPPAPPSALAMAPSASSSPGLRVLFWNLARRRQPHHELLALLHEQQPDLAGFVEAGHSRTMLEPLRPHLPPGYEFRRLPSGMAVITRGETQVTRHRVLPTGSRLTEIRLFLHGESWTVLLVDVQARPTLSREDALATALEWVKDRPRTIVMGDFNTPLESRWFDPWRREMIHVFNEAGHGWRETWPYPVPILTLDHLWCSRDVRPLQARRVFRVSSDHAALQAVLSSW